MISLKKRGADSKGFTIVELLIVIVVIGILALLVITTYSGIQAKARNSKRQTDIQSLQTHLEAYFSQQGYYPTLAHMNDPSWRSTNIQSLDSNALKDPSSSCSVTTTTGCLVAAPAAKSYAYAPTQSDGTTSCSGDETGCAKYTLTATFEGNVNGQPTYVKSNLD